MQRWVLHVLTYRNSSFVTSLRHYTRYDMIFNLMPDIDLQETKEWLEALEVVIESDGLSRAQFILNQLTERARLLGVSVNIGRTTPYINTIPVENEEHMPDDDKMLKRLLSLLRWNAVAM